MSLTANPLIQVNSNNSIGGRVAVDDRVQQMVEQSLSRFLGRLSRIEVHLSDTNAEKGGDRDKHCSIEARIEGRRPLAVTSEEQTMERAVRSACDKLKARLSTELERGRAH